MTNLKKNGTKVKSNPKKKRNSTTLNRHSATSALTDNETKTKHELYQAIGHKVEHYLTESKRDCIIAQRKKPLKF